MFQFVRFCDAFAADDMPSEMVNYAVCVNGQMRSGHGGPRGLEAAIMQAAARLTVATSEVVTIAFRDGYFPSAGDAESRRNSASDLDHVYQTSQYRSMRPGGTHEVQVHENGPVEIYAPALQPDDWYIIRTVGVLADGSELELSEVIVKR